MSDSRSYPHPHAARRPHDVRRRAGVMERYWRRELESWKELPVCVNAGDEVVEGKLLQLAPKALIVDLGGSGFGEILYDDVIEVELLL